MINNTILPSVLSVITTQKCTAACENCCFGCLPTHTQRLSKSEIFSFIKDSTDFFPTLEVCVFTGGECTLLGQDLIDSISYAKNLGLGTRIVTNGFWATNLERATKKIQKFKDAGLDEINFSTGDNHANFVSVKNIIWGALASVNLGYRPFIMKEVFAESQFPIDEFTSNKDFNDAVDTGKIEVTGSPWMSFTKSRKVSYTENQIKEFEPRSKGRCNSVNTTLTLGPEGSLYACCGLPQREIPELRIGQLNEGFNESLLSEFHDNLKLYLNIHGPWSLFEQLKSLDPTLEMPQNTLHICDICRFTLKDKKCRYLLEKHGADILKNVKLDYKKLVFTEALSKSFTYKPKKKFEREITSIADLRKNYENK